METFVAKVTAVLFIASIVTTALFWTIFSNSEGLSQRAQQQAAQFISNNYRRGDIVFPLREWDLGFTRYLDEKVTSLLTGFSRLSPEQLRLTARGKKRFFIVSDTKGVTADILTTKDLNLVTLQAIDGGEVALVAPAHPLPPLLIDFPQDIMNAKRVWFSDDYSKNIIECRKGAVWHCSHREWNRVGFYRAVVNGTPQDAVWAHPLSHKTLHILFELPAGSKQILFTSSFLPTAYQKQNGDFVTVSLFADEQQLFHYKNMNIRRQYRHTATIPEGAQELEIRIHVNRDGARHFIFGGYVKQ